MFLDILILIGSLVLGFAIFFIPIVLISEYLRFYFGAPIIAIIYTTGLTVGVLYWQPLSFITIAVMWSAALLPIFTEWLMIAWDKIKEK